MKLSRHLILFRYLLQQFGFDGIEQLRNEFRDKRAGYDNTGRSYFMNILLAGATRSVTDNELAQYDEAIRGYEERLVRHRGEPWLSFKYYQYFALLFTECFFDRISNNPQALLSGLNEYKRIDKELNSIPDFVADDLKKLAYWMATGSGKTLVMHVNYWQITKYFPEWENILLITPNEGLSQQHYDELRLSGIPAKLYGGSEESLKTNTGEILILEITKLTRDKEGEGVSIDVDYFSESKNLVFIDEGHKGQRSEEKAWKKLREYLTRGEQSFTFEYSATFGQIIGNNATDLLHEYGKAMIFDYSYRYFYEDGYGKDFSVFNIENNTQDYTDREVHLLLTASLLGFYEQLALFEKYENQLKPYNIEKPLWVFVGSKVIGKKTGKTDEAKIKKLTSDEKATVSDVSLVIKFFQKILAAPENLMADIKLILGGNSGINKAGDDIFKDRFLFLKQNSPTSEEVLTKVFHGAGSIEPYHIRQADGEIGLRTNDKEYFGVINIGDVTSFGKKLEEDTDNTVEMLDDHFTPSLFRSVSERLSKINILIGSKKFIEGWNSWRVSSMGLMNMGRGEGAQIIQLFGRGVRLKGKEFSLKREEESAPYYIRALQTIAIFGLNADYMSSFLTNIEKEVERPIEYIIKINFNNVEEWQNKIVTFKSEAGITFKNQSILLAAKKAVLKRILIDLRPRISIAAGGFNSQIAESESTYQHDNPLHVFGAFIDQGKLLLAINSFKAIRGYTNLVVESPVLKEIIASEHYGIATARGQYTIAEAVMGKLQPVAEAMVKDYINKFYSDKEKDHLTKNLGFDFLNETNYPEVFPLENRMVVKVPERLSKQIEPLIKNFEDFCKVKNDDIPTIHFDRHLYSPIAVYKKGKEEIKTVPVKLNKGETDFIRQFREYIFNVKDKFKDKEIFVLRNLSKRGVGFFIESSSFYPDFIIWVVDAHSQTVYFVDPKGILNMGNLKNDKIIFCTETIADINEAINKKIKSEKRLQQVELKAFILSITSFEDLKTSWGIDITKEEFEQHKVLFLDESKDYLIKMFGQFEH